MPTEMMKGGKGATKRLHQLEAPSSVVSATPSKEVNTTGSQLPSAVGKAANAASNTITPSTAVAKVDAGGKAGPAGSSAWWNLWGWW
jgi:hypothetical protein